MPKSPDELFEYLRALGLETETHDHAPVMTVAENKALRGDLPGAHCKNLFLKDKKGQFWLIVAEEDREIDLKALRRLIGAAHLSFGKADALMAVLGVEPGTVTPFGLINDTESRVRVVLDAGLMAHALLNFHPLTNRASTAIAPRDLLAFMRALGHAPEIVAI